MKVSLMTTNPLFGKKQLQSDELERDFQERVVALARTYGWSVYAVPDSRRASLAGYPDLTMWNERLGKLIFVELKREKGKTSPAQERVLDQLRVCKQQVYVWRPSDWDGTILRTIKGN